MCTTILATSLLRVQRLSNWVDKELSEGGELAKALDSVKDTLKGPTISNPTKTFNSTTARWIIYIYMHLNQIRLGKGLASFNSMTCDLGHLTQARALLLTQLARYSFFLDLEPTISINPTSKGHL